MKRTLAYAVLFLVGFSFTGCEALEKTDLVKREVVMQVKDRTLVYEMYVTGLDKFQYKYRLAKGADTLQLFEAKLVDESGNDVQMEIDRTGTGFKINVNKPIENQQKTVDGVTYELVGTKK